jgi:hypothetical protein
LILAPQENIKVEPYRHPSTHHTPKVLWKSDVPNTKVNLSIFCNHFLYGMVQKGGRREVPSPPPKKEEMRERKI